MVQFYYLGLVFGIIALLFSAYASYVVLRRPKGSKKMEEIGNAIKSGSKAYLNRQLMVIGIFVVIIALLLLLMQNGEQVAIAFVVGAATSYLTAYLGMNIAVRANVRTARAAEDGIKSAFSTAIIGGSVTGFAAVGFGLVGISLLLAYLTVSKVAILIGFGFGASLVSLFARVGGGIFTKSADVGADLVGKTELNLPEDDPRNPAVIADNVGDNVGDCAGMAADVYESYVVTIVAALLIAVGVSQNALQNASMIAYPLYIASAGVVGSLASMLVLKAGRNVVRALYKGIGLAIITSGAIDALITSAMGLPFSYFVATFSGLVLAMLLFAITDYYTGSGRKQVVKIANAARSGAGTNVIMGLSVGLRTTFFPVIFIVAAILISYFAVGGVYGIGIAAVGMLSITATILTIDSFGPITDNAGGIAEMTGMPGSVRKVTDHLDAIGNTTKATTKGFAIGGAALSATALFVAFSQALHITTIDALNPAVTAGIFLGALLPMVFSSFLMEAVGKTANLMVEEVRRQVRTIKGLLKGTTPPNYARAVDIVTVHSLKALIVPELIAIATPILVGLVLGKAALGGLLVGMIPTSLVMALFMSNAGAAMDNAKKYIETGKFGGKGSDAHKAAVVGDTVGDPLKDTAGPALNSLIKVVSTISILLAPVFLAYALM